MFGRAGRKLVYGDAKLCHKKFRQKRGPRIRLRRKADDFYIAAEPKLAFVIRTRGTNAVNTKV